MIRKSLTFAALLVFALALVPTAVATDGALASDVTSVSASAPFSTELIGADADTWIDRFQVQSSCDRDTCIFQCNVSRNICFSSGTGFATCMLLYEYCLDDCYTNCT